MSVSKGLIAGIIAALLCMAIGWGLAQTFARRDADRAEAARAAIEAHAARAAESRRKVLADIAAGAALEAKDAQRARKAREAQEAEIRARQAALSALPESPDWLGRKYLIEGDWKKLEELVESLAASGKRAPDGRFELHLLTSEIALMLEHTDEAADRKVLEKIAAYQRQFPKSAFAALLPAMQLHGAAWRARGSGYSSSVTAEGRSLFAERNRQAWQEIVAVRSRSDRLPTWYEQAIKIGMDANIEGDELMNLFEEGIERFPGYHAIYSATVRQFSPRWGGNYADADAFVRAQVAATTNTEGETLYTRLYWQLDSYGGGELDFFEESRVDWLRMRAGFEALFKKYPVPSNRARFASFACRSGDGSTYLKLRKDIGAAEFEEVAPQGVSLEVCDARFLQET